jgi:hypothetical protein
MLSALHRNRCPRRTGFRTGAAETATDRTKTLTIVSK